KNLNSCTFFIVEETHFLIGKSNLEREEIGKTPNRKKYLSSV
ncbi:unnamed protein product, partial [marine sediment metagenome]